MQELTIHQQTFQQFIDECETESDESTEGYVGLFTSEYIDEPFVEEYVDDEMIKMICTCDFCNVQEVNLED